MRTPKIQVDTPRQTERPQPQARQPPPPDADFQQLALKHTSMIKTYIQEINQLQQLKEDLLSNQLARLKETNFHDIERALKVDLKPKVAQEQQVVETKQQAQDRLLAELRRMLQIQ